MVSIALHDIIESKKFVKKDPSLKSSDDNAFKTKKKNLTMLAKDYKNLE
tara:strand:+ start:1694 stop:1840 length:147 start_codon:yes stop_codon:yes gene_type:complete